MNQPTYINFDKGKFREELQYYNLKGEIGVLSYSFSKILSSFWRFKTPELAEISAKAIYGIFLRLINVSNRTQLKDFKFHLFMKADLCRKFLQMGYTRSMRYYYHQSGRKWEKKNNQWIILPFDYDYEKKQSALIFKKYWDLAKNNAIYTNIKSQFMKLTRDERIKIMEKYPL